MNVLICVGSSCHLKGAPELVELFQKAIEENHLEGLVTLSGITKESFKDFFNDKILGKIKGGV